MIDFQQECNQIQNHAGYFSKYKRSASEFGLLNKCIYINKYSKYNQPEGVLRNIEVGSL